MQTGASWARELEGYVEHTARDTMVREGLTYEDALRRARVEMGREWAESRG